MNNPMIKPFLKWAGGKRQLLPELRKYYPQTFNNYYEPFVGAGAVFMDIQPRRLVINDFNSELTNAYITVRDSVEELIMLLKKHKQNNNKDYFYQLREYDRDGTVQKMTNIERAARFIYLNKTCFNGLFRVNSQNQFNVPYGNYKNPNIVNEDVLRTDSKYFNRVNLDIVNGDFEQCVMNARRGDFIYLDPPYAPVAEDSDSFVGYTLNGFGAAEQERLRDLFITLDRRGCYLMLSNSSVPMIHELYADYEDTTQIIRANRAINSNASGRGKVDEVLIMNYRV